MGKCEDDKCKSVGVQCKILDENKSELDAHNRLKKSWEQLHKEQEKLHKEQEKLMKEKEKFEQEKAKAKSEMLKSRNQVRRNDGEIMGPPQNKNFKKFAFPPVRTKYQVPKIQHQQITEEDLMSSKSNKEVMRRRNLFKPKNPQNKNHFNMVPVFPHNHHGNRKRPRLEPNTVPIHHLLKKIPPKNSPATPGGDGNGGVTIVEGNGEEVAMATGEEVSVVTDDVVANSDAGGGDYSEDLESISSDIFSRALFENMDDQNSLGYQSEYQSVDPLIDENSQNSQASMIRALFNNNNPANNNNYNMQEPHDTNNNDTFNRQVPMENANNNNVDNTTDQQLLDDLIPVTSYNF